MKQSVAEWYRYEVKEKVRRRVRRAHPGRVQQRPPSPTATLADRIPHPVPSKAAQGRTKTRLVPDPVTAPVVEQIYSWRITGRARHGHHREPAQRRPGAYPPPGKSRVLAGRHHRQDPRQPQVHRAHGLRPHPHQERQARPPHPPDQWLWTPEPAHPAIITRATWDAAQTAGAAHCHQHRHPRPQQPPPGQDRLPAARHHPLPPLRPPHHRPPPHRPHAARSPSTTTAPTTPPTPATPPLTPTTPPASRSARTTSPPGSPSSSTPASSDPTAPSSSPPPSPTPPPAPAASANRDTAKLTKTAPRHRRRRGRLHPRDRAIRATRRRQPRRHRAPDPHPGPVRRTRNRTRPDQRQTRRTRRRHPGRTRPRPPRPAAPPGRATQPRPRRTPAGALPPLPHPDHLPPPGEQDHLPRHHHPHHHRPAHRAHQQPACSHAAAGTRKRRPFCQTHLSPPRCLPDVDASRETTASGRHRYCSRGRPVRPAGQVHLSLSGAVPSREAAAPLPPWCSPDCPVAHLV